MFETIESYLFKKKNNITDESSDDWNTIIIEPEDAEKLKNELQHLKEQRALIQESIQTMIKNEDNRILLYSIGLSSPIMQWAKDTKGVYTYANKALAQHLFGTDDPRDLIGKDDSQIGAIVTKKYPKWTFGSICMGTDQMTLELDKPMKFYEWGVIKEDFQYVTAFKNTYKDKDGKILGTCGLAIYVTDEVNALLDILESTKDQKTAEGLKKYLHKFGFECNNMFTDQNIENFWEKR